MSHTSAFPTCCHFEFGTALQKSPMHVRMFAREVKTYVFRESVRLSSLCNSVAPQYAQTNLKQAQSIKARSTPSYSLFIPLVFPPVLPFRPLIQDHLSRKLRGTKHYKLGLSSWSDIAGYFPTNAPKT